MVFSCSSKRFGWGLAIMALASWGLDVQATQEEREVVAEGPATTGDPTLREGLHVVRPGDTLESITARYLGSPKRWRENWKLNPSIEDPHRIVPGQRIRVWVQSLPADGALVTKLANRVEDKLLPLPWADASDNDLLRPDDNVRTFEASSAELLFPDATRLRLTESSLVILGQAEVITPERSRTEVEIELGQADLARHGGGPTPNREIEIVLGDAVAQPEVTEDGALSTRARKVETGAQLMVYTGRSTLASAGREVAVEEGMGSQVQDGSPPSPPEELLPAATGLEPAAGEVLGERRPLFAWQPVPGAASYTVEICRDPECGQLVQRRTGITEPRWRSAELPWESLFWRVTATSPSGLDGYPTEASALKLEQITDAMAPTVELVVEGPRGRRGERLIVGPGFTIDPRTEDGGSGLASTSLWIDGEKATEAELAGPWTTGEHTVELSAVDKAGNEGRARLEFVYDDVPPTVSWGLQGVGLFGRGLEVPFGEEGPPVSGRGPAMLEGGGRSFAIDSDHTQVIVKPGGSKLRLPGADQPLTRDRGAWILFEDEVCGLVDGLRYGLEDRATPDGKRRSVAVLVAEASDCVGNHTRIAWPIEPAGRR